MPLSPITSSIHFIFVHYLLYLNLTMYVLGGVKMSKRNVLLSLGIGVLAGYVLNKKVKESTMITPEQALKVAKAKFAVNGEIEGSWIHTKQENFRKNGLSYNVYQGGLTLNEQGEIHHYEFLVDADTGTILSATKQ